MPAPRAGGWCKSEKALEWKILKVVKETDKGLCKKQHMFVICSDIIKVCFLKLKNAFDTT